MKTVNLLKDSFLFRGMTPEEIESIISKSPPTVISFRRGQEVFSSTSGQKQVGFILGGRCEVRLSRPDGYRTVLNILSPTDSFGILSVYSAEAFPTQIFATKNSEIIYFTDEQIKDFVNSNLQISSNLINFLAGRIQFLNKKVATFSGVRASDRLAAFILCESERLGADSFDFNCQKTAEEINAGRASVYRAISTLTELGLISFSNKKIQINDREGLERIIK